jgi:hypothetical protein
MVAATDWMSGALSINVPSRSKTMFTVARRNQS